MERTGTEVGADEAPVKPWPLTVKAERSDARKELVWRTAWTLGGVVGLYLAWRAVGLLRDAVHLLETQ